jgi:L-cysteine/cystine lyase
MKALRAEIPALANKRYFNYGGQGTMPQVAMDAVAEAYRFVQQKGPFSTAMFKWIIDELVSTRRLLAEEYGGEPDCWALTSNVTEACNIVLWGMDWQPGERLLLSDSEHVGIIGAAENIARRLKVQLDYFAVAGKSPEEILSALQSALTPQTKLVLFSHVLWNTGQNLPVADMCAMIADHGAQSLVDGAQSAGAIALDVVKTNADYYSLTGHKWICGPEGTGALYVRKDRLATLQPTYTGWRMDMTGKPGEGRIDGSRFEVATNSFALLTGWRAAIEFHKGTPDRTKLILENADRLRKGLETISGLRCFGDQRASSGLVSFAIQDKSHAKVVAELEQQHFMLRTIPNPDAVRASVHYFTTAEEIDSLIEKLR